MMDIRICQFFKLVDRNGNTYAYQNYFSKPGNTRQFYANTIYDFAPFRAEGSTAGLNGENSVLQVLFPNIEVALRLLEVADGNRLTRLELATVWLTANDLPAQNQQYTEFFIGIGSSISETTLELRFRSAIDSVASNFPARVLTRQNVGILPLDAQISMR